MAKRGLPIGNLTSQIFANVYLDALDHFIKEELRIHYYIRYTDDAVIIHQDSRYLQSLISIISAWLWDHRRQELHPRKVSIGKLSQGIDFLGYVNRPHYSVLRTKTKRRMFNRVTSDNLQSYLGLLEHCSGHELEKQLINHVYRTKKTGYSD